MVCRKARGNRILGRRNRATREQAERAAVDGPSPPPQDIIQLGLVRLLDNGEPKKSGDGNRSRIGNFGIGMIAALRYVWLEASEWVGVEY